MLAAAAAVLRVMEIHEQLELKLTSLPKWERFLKPGITKEFLESQARRRTDVEAARRMQNAKNALLAKCRSRFGGLPR